MVDYSETLFEAENNNKDKKLDYTYTKLEAGDTDARGSAGTGETDKMTGSNIARKQGSSDLKHRLIMSFY